MKVTFDNVYNAFQIIAPKGTMISFTGEPTALADGVYLVGDDGIINLDEQFLTDTLYLSTEGTDYAVTGGVRVIYPLGDETLIIRAGSSAIPFSKGWKGGGGSSGGCNYKGTTTTPISNGSTTNPIIIDGEEYTAVFGDIVVYGYTEFVFDGTQWGEFGRPFDTTPTSGSANAVTSDGIQSYVYNNSSNWKRGTGYLSAVLGEGNPIASGRGSASVGYHTTASAVCSVAMGSYTIASKRLMLSIGEYNSPRDGDLFNIGNGTADNARSNIVEVNSTELNVNGDIQKNGVSLPTPYTTMPTITAAMLGQIAMYVGTTDANYTKGYFYIAASDGAAEPTYSWVSMVDSTPTSGSKNFVTSDGVYQVTPWKRGTGASSVCGENNAQASGSNALAFGYASRASGNYSVAIGRGTQATNGNMFTCGIYNTVSNDTLFAVGAGTSNTDRKNIIEASTNVVNVNGDIQRDGVGIDDYTTTERKIGKWIDGSDLYQRTFVVTELTKNTFNYGVLGTSGIDIKDVTGYIEWTYNDEQNVRTALDYYVNTGDCVSLHNAYTDINIKPYRVDTGFNITEAVITIKYTKLSEQANLMQASAPTEEVSETPTVEEDDMR